MAKRIELEALPNTRDLGGLKACGGRTVAPRRLIRSGELSPGTAADIKTLTCEYGLKTIVDLRSPLEREGRPDPEIPGVSYVSLPVLDERTLGMTREDGDVTERQSLRDMLYSPGFDAAAYMTGTYRALITSERSLARYKRFFGVLLSHEEGALLWHCSAGKDRAGVAAAFILTALGVPREAVIEDYMSTNTFLRDDAPKKARELGITEPHILHKLRTVFGVSEAYILAVFDYMERTCGSAEGFLQERLGIGQEERELLRRKYLI